MDQSAKIVINLYNNNNNNCFVEKRHDSIHLIYNLLQY